MFAIRDMKIMKNKVVVYLWVVEFQTASFSVTSVMSMHDFYN